MTQVDTIVEPAAVEEFMGRLLGEIAVAAALPTTLLGIRLGLWRAMAGVGSGGPGRPRPRYRPARAVRA